MNSKRKLLEALREMANLKDVIRDTHGNVSCIEPGGIVRIKPSGMEYSLISEEDICSVAVIDGHDLGSIRTPSVDTKNHLDIYRRHPWVGAICHTHSPHATAFAWAQAPIPCYGTEQADYFGGEIRCLQYADLDSWGDRVELREGERAVLLGRHGCLTFAEDPVTAVKLAIALENIAEKAYLARELHYYPFDPMPQDQVDRWHKRYLHGYGQR